MPKSKISRKKSTTKSAAKITAESNILEIVHNYPKTVDVFQKYGFHCVGCALAQYENIGQGAQVHGIDVKKLLADLNKNI